MTNSDPIAAAFSATTDVVRVSLADAIVGVLSFVPPALGALVVLGGGIALASLIASAVSYVTTGLGFDTLSERTSFTRVLQFFGDGTTFSDVVGVVARVAVITASVLASFRIIGFEEGVLFGASILAYIPRIAVAFLAVLAGFIGAEFGSWMVRRLVTFLRVPLSRPAVLSLIVRSSMIAVGCIAALRALGATERMIEMLFVAVIAAFALSFGLGGKERATSFLGRLDK